VNESRRILIDVGHPADFHFFRGMAGELSARGWRCLFVAKDKDIMAPLLAAYPFPHRMLTANRGGAVQKILKLPASLRRFFRLVREFRPDNVAGMASLHASWICALLRIPHIAFIDTEPRKLLDALTLPFVQAKITATSYLRELGKNQYRIPGTHELAYLHSGRFQAAASVREELGLEQGESYAIVRFVAWKAIHDVGQPHMDRAARIRLVEMIGARKRVFITSETALPAELRALFFPLPPHRIHDALAFADLYVGEGITMAAEAVTLGVPAVLINSLRMGYCMEAERAGMLFSFPSLTPAALQKIEELLSAPYVRDSFSRRHEEYLAGKIDVTRFMVWFFEHYPASLEMLRKDPSLVHGFV